MNKHSYGARHSLQKLCFLGTLGLCLLMAGCLGGKSSSPWLEGAEVRTLPLGIAIAVPAGWQVTNAAEASSLTQEAITTRLAAGERIPLLDMKRVDSKGEQTARAFLLLMNSGREFMPEQEAKTLNAEGFAKLGETILRVDKEMAAKNNQQSRISEWAVAPTTVDGNFAIGQQGLGAHPRGQLFIHYVDVYLPQSVGLAVRLIAHKEENGSKETLNAIVQSITIAK